MKYLSLCLPTNGIVEWVFPVLDNIYKQDVDQSEWELVVTDNGKSEEFYEKMTAYAAQHGNLKYKRTDAFLFENQIECLRLAEGEYLKFLNHRSVFEPGAVQWMIDLVKACIVDKPIIYLSNGMMKFKQPHVYDSFDEFVRGLREYASWTTGVGVWRSDFEEIPRNWSYNKISPHSDVLFWERNREKYIINDKVWAHDIDCSHAKKGKYDLYRTFAVEEITITLGLLNDRSISADTFKYIVRCYEKCVAGFYTTFNIMRQPCSYILDGFDDAMGIFVNKRRVLFLSYMRAIRILLGRIYMKCQHSFFYR